MELSNDDILKLLNPLNFSGLHFLCDPCEKEVVAGGKEKEPEVRIQSSQSTQPHQSLPQGPNDETNTDSSDQIIATAEEENRDEDPSCNSAKILINQQVNATTNQQENANRDNSDRNSLKKITCKFYKKGSCRHGLLGDECKFNHPAMCKQYTQHGSRQPRGCNKGKDCQFFHPQMCINSLRTGKCLSQHCRFRHIRGTVRHNDAGETNRVPEKPMEDKTKTKKAEVATKQAASDLKQPKDVNPFLEEFRLLKAELLQEMDTKVRIAIQSQLLQSQQQVQFLNKPQQQTQMPNQNLSHQFPQVIQAYHQQNPIQFQQTPINLAQQQVNQMS